MSTQSKHTLGTKFYVADPAVPGTFIQAKEMIAPPPVGATNPLVKVTYSDAAGEEYIGGRPDGDNPTVKFNHIEQDPGQKAIRDYSDARTNFDVRVVIPSDPQKIYGFTVTPQRAAVDPSNIDGQQVMEFMYKVSGAVDRNASL
jgi:hypothetical protein